MMTVESLVKEAERRGLVLNNLFQIQNKRWRCNFRDARTSTPYVFGHGDTMVEAIDAALNPKDGELRVAATSGKPARDQVAEKRERESRAATPSTPNSVFD